MLNNHFYCIIMAGGVGSRFWPISRLDKPKQFLDFTTDGTSFLRMAYDRMKAIIPDDNILVVSLSRYEEQVREQLPELKEENLLLEPYNRNTAPCITYATYKLLKRDPDAVMVVTPADHIIKDSAEFNETISNAMAYAAGSDTLISIGVMPSRPDPNFGYIQMAGPYEEGKPVKVKTFTEKPDKELAQVFISTGEFLWNTGIFIWSAMTMGLMLMHLDGDPYAAARTISEHDLSASEEATYVKNYFPSELPRSMDLLILEKCHNVAVLECDFGWADIGCWGGLRDNLPHDADGNAITGRGKVLLNASQNNLISLPEGYTAIVNGLDRYVVALNGKTLLISPHHDAEALRRLINEAMVNL